MKQSAVVTGGASGIGLAVVERLLEDGWPVAVIDADAAALAEAEDNFAGESAIFIEADPTDEDELAEAFDQAVDSLGLIGGLVNCMEIWREASAEETSAELLREMLDVNLVGPFMAAKAALERMGQTLAIVNIGSVSGVRANRGNLAYGASKAALKMMSDTLAIEFAGHGVRGKLRRPRAGRCARACSVAAAEAVARIRAAGAPCPAGGSGGGGVVFIVAGSEFYHRPDDCRRWRADCCRNLPRRLEAILGKV
jgi:NADP-dependent 3-hydroxy acid dehydrogenase YdfG